MSVVAIDLARPIDLSHISDPVREEYRLEVDTRQAEEWPEFAHYPRLPDAWYVLSQITMSTHVGTHVEMPLHHHRDGTDVATMPATVLAGEGVAIDISPFRANNTKIELASLKAVCGDRIRPGDMAFFFTGNDEFYYTPRRHERPWFTTECIDWLVDDAKIKLMGVDTSGHEVRNPDGTPTAGQPNHERLLGAGVPLIEYLTNLEELLTCRFVAFVLPPRIAGAEAFPVRVVAFELTGDAL